jgi:hypothetical protein
VNKFNGNRTPPPEQKDTASSDTLATGERRRLGRVVHDDRGAASLEWHDAPEDHERPVFRIEGTGVKEPLSVQQDQTFNPYDRTTLDGPAKPKGGKRDLKKLSAWVKMMRELEERKKRGD